MSVRTRFRAALAIVLATACSSSTTPGGPVPAALVVSPDSVFLFRGDSVQLTVNVLDKDSTLITGVAVSFSSSDPTMVTVSNLGLVRSAGPSGKAHVTVTGAGLHRDVPVTVQGKPKTLVVNPTDTTIRQGQSYQLRTVVLDSLGDSVASQPRTYQSQNSAIVLVSTGGVVTTGPLAGQTTIRVSSGGLTTFTAVTVKDTNLVARVPLADAPYGVATSVTGVVYVTPIVGPAVRRVNMTTFTLSDNIPVGGDPAQVAFNGAGDTAYVTKRASGAVGIISVATLWRPGPGSIPQPHRRRRSTSPSDPATPCSMCRHMTTAPLPSFAPPPWRHSGPSRSAAFRKPSRCPRMARSSISRMKPGRCMSGV